MQVGIAALFVEDAPEYEFRNGMFYCTDGIGNMRVMRPYTFLQAFARAAEAARQYKYASAEVIPIKSVVGH